MIVAAETGMGNLLTRTARKFAFDTFAPPGDKAAALKAFTKLQAYARWVENAEQTIARVRVNHPTDNRITTLEMIVQDVRGSLLSVDSIAREAVRKAQEDGHDIRIQDNSVGLGIAPLVVLAIGAAVALVVLAYVWGEAEKWRITKEFDNYFETEKERFNVTLLALQQGLIPGNSNPFEPGPRPGDNAGGGVSPWLVTGLGALVVAGVVGVAFAVGGKRR